MTSVPFDAEGRFQRPAATLRNWITPDGSAGPMGRAGYRAEAGRYHLYIAEGCPWCHRTWIFRKLKALEHVVPMSMVAVAWGPRGWTFDDSERYRDRLHGRAAVRDIYEADTPDYAGPATVPVLWDDRTRTIVSNESSDIIRMFNAAFDHVTGNSDDYYPAELSDEIDELNERIYHRLNNAVYRAGFAQSQLAYEEAFDDVFETLAFLEERLATRRYLCGDRITEADWRLFPTLVRFDVAYVGCFRCDLRRLVDYPNLLGYTRELYQRPGIAETVVPDIYRVGYYSIPIAVGHGRIIPKGPVVDFAAPHGRGS